MKKIFPPLAIVLSVSCSSVHAGVIFDFNYTDVGMGFNDAVQGAERRSALESAGSYLSSFLTGYDATIMLDVNGAETGSETLASASSHYNSPHSGVGFTDKGDVMTKILGGNSADPASNQADGIVNWNFNQSWELGTDFQLGEYDFFSTAVHEITHALGFSSGILQNGNDIWGNPPGTAGVWSSFDEFLTDSNGNSIIDKSTFELDGTLWDAAKLSQDVFSVNACNKGLRFNGANAVAANGGESIEIYAPSTWSEGSSGSHLDDNCYTSAGNVNTNLMESASIPGFGNRNFSAIEIGMMRDIGYTKFGLTTSHSVSEPVTFFTMFAGVFGLFSMRARTKK